MSIDTVSDKKFLLITLTLVSAIMLVLSSMLSLVPIQAFAEKEESSTEDVLVQENRDSNRQEDFGENKRRDDIMVVDPIVQTSVQTAVNIAVDVDVVRDKESCEEASDNVNQINDLSSSQSAGSSGNEDEGNVSPGPIIQTSTQLALNLYVDSDVILTEDCIPRDNVNQINDLSSSQSAGSSGNEDEDNTISLPIYQREDSVAKNKSVNKDAIIPLNLPL